jgi:putative alpha-1,2-mannosidase
VNPKMYGLICFCLCLSCGMVSAEDLKLEFVDPPLTYAPRPLWFWNNTTVTAEGIVEQMQQAHDQCGYGGFGILPFGKEFKPTYLTEAYFKVYGVALSKARELGMTMCIYDEYGFPSGSAGAINGDGVPRFANQFPNHTVKRLDKHEQDVVGPAMYSAEIPEGRLMSVVAMDMETKTRVDLSDTVKDGKVTWSVPQGKWKVMVFVCVKDGDPNVDYLDPEGVAHFVQMTHQQYYDRFKEYFGNTIDGTFNDEPTMYRAKGRMWTGAFNETFKTKHGFDPAPWYPALWYDIGPDTQAARNYLFGFRSELYATGFPKVIQDWCDRLGISATGHQDQEEVINPVSVAGDLMKCFKHQDIPGVDKIGGNRPAERFYKVISSAAYNWDKALVMSETYGAMGDISWDTMYRVAMEQYTKGINQLIPHAVWYDDQKVTFKPELSWRHQKYAERLPQYTTYMSRLNLMLQNHGRHVADIAVLYPIATLQGGHTLDGKLGYYKGGVAIPEADYVDIGELLATQVGRDYTFLHPEVLDEKCRVQGSSLMLDNPINHETYQVMIMPGHQTINWSNLQKIKAFYDQGGKVIATGTLPFKSAEFGHDDDVVNTIEAMFPRSKNEAGGMAIFLKKPTADALRETLDRMLDVYDVEFEVGKELRYIHKVKDGKDIYFLANLGSTPISAWIELRGTLSPESWNPHTGDISRPAYSHEKRGVTDVTKVKIELSPITSLFIADQQGPDHGPAKENLAPLAMASGSGTGHPAAVDGVKQQDGTGEWIGGSPNAWYGWINYPTLELTWQAPRKINKVVLYDRPTAEEHMAACVLTFSDNSEVHVVAVPNDGSPRTVSFEPRTVTSMTLSVVDGVGKNIGLSEVEVYYDPAAQPETRRVGPFTDYVSYVDPTIETGRGRWFFCTPGSRPFGMICASAYTRNKNQGGGGYNYNSTEILGFAQIHAWIMSGINIMPVTGQVNPNLGEKEWKSSFSHETETMEPGYHRLFLDRYQTQVEYTSTDRVAFYRLTYGEAAEAKLLLQLGGFVGAASYVDGKATFVSPTRIEGSHGMTDRLWGGPKLSHVYFVMELDRPIRRMDGWKGASEKLNSISTFHNPIPEGRLEQDKRNYLFKNHPEEQAGVSLAYDVDPGDEVMVKIGISYTSIENARNNLKAECAHWDFNRVRNEARDEWNRWLGKIDVKGGEVETRVKFYTDLWHTLLGRHKIDDVSGDYPCFMGDARIRTVAKNASGRPTHHMYNSDALWLTMWNLNILWGLGWPEMLDEFSASMVEYAEAGGHLPRGPSAGGYTGIMTGCPATSLITATWQKNLLKKVDEDQAYQAMKRSHTQLIKGNNTGIKVQGAFEYWALAQMAEELGRHADVQSFQTWIDGWKACFDPNTNLLTGRWVEANDWQGTFGVSHDIKGLATLMGGSGALAKKLNYAFEQGASSHFVYTYNKGYVSYANQPGCSNAHVFNHADHPWLSQYWVRRVSQQAYGGTNPNIGYGGHDEDQGQMGGVSALMKLGLFSLRGTCSQEPVYEITAPQFDDITIQLDPRYYVGKTFRIKTHHNSRENCYIQKAELNGEPLNTCWFYHRDFTRGGLLELWLGPTPNKRWGKSPIQN